jgi:hypothetical protein
MSEETQNVDAGTDEPQYLEGLGESQEPIQASEGEQQPLNPVDELEAFDENLMPPEFVQDEPASPEGNIEPKGDKGRYEYWQSKYDTLERDYNKQMEELKGLEKVVPIANYIEKNPQVLKAVASDLSGNPQQVSAEGESADLPKKPKRPVKPANYDPSEAYMDVDSSSYKYRESLDNYRDEMIDYSDRAEVHRVRQLEAQEAQVRQAQREYEAQKDVDEMHNSLVNQYGYTPDKAKEFVQYYTSPGSVTLDNLVRLDKIRSAPSQAEVDQRQKAESMKQKQTRLSVPPPPATGTGYSEPQLTEEDAFNLGLMQNKRV